MGLLQVVSVVSLVLESDWKDAADPFFEKYSTHSWLEAGLRNFFVGAGGPTTVRTRRDRVGHDGL